jgi:hypothetical protein
VLRCFSPHGQISGEGNSPSKTAISGYAGLLQSLRSDVVNPHTHSCRFTRDAGLKVVDAQKHLSFTAKKAFKYSRAHILFAAPMVGEQPDNIGAQRLAEGGVPASGAGSAKDGLNAVSVGQSSGLAHRQNRWAWLNQKEAILPQAPAKPSMPCAKACRACVNICRFQVSVSV